MTIHLIELGQSMICECGNILLTKHRVLKDETSSWTTYFGICNKCKNHYSITLAKDTK